MCSSTCCGYRYWGLPFHTSGNLMILKVMTEQLIGLQEFSFQEQEYEHKFIKL